MTLYDIPELEQEEDLGPDPPWRRDDSSALQPSSQIAHAGLARKVSHVVNLELVFFSIHGAFLYHVQIALAVVLLKSEIHQNL